MDLVKSVTNSASVQRIWALVKFSKINVCFAKNVNTYALFLVKLIKKLGIFLVYNPKSATFFSKNSAKQGSKASFSIDSLPLLNRASDLEMKYATSEATH